VASGLALVGVSVAAYRAGNGSLPGLFAALGVGLLLAVATLAFVRRSSQRMNAQRQPGEIFRGVAIFAPTDLAACIRSRTAADALVRRRLMRTNGRVQGVLTLTSEEVRFLPDEVAVDAGMETFVIPVSEILAVSCTPHIGNVAGEVHLHWSSPGSPDTRGVVNAIMPQERRGRLWRR